MAQDNRISQLYPVANLAIWLDVNGRSDRAILSDHRSRFNANRWYQPRISADLIRRRFKRFIAMREVIQIDRQQIFRIGKGKALVRIYASDLASLVDEHLDSAGQLIFSPDR